MVVFLTSLAKMVERLSISAPHFLSGSERQTGRFAPVTAPVLLQLNSCSSKLLNATLCSHWTTVLARVP